MHTPHHVQVFYCTKDLRSLMLELPIDGLLEQGAKILTASEFEHLRSQLQQGRTARVDGPDCWFEYQVVGAVAA